MKLKKNKLKRICVFLSTSIHYHRSIKKKKRTVEILEPLIDDFCQFIINWDSLNVTH